SILQLISINRGQDRMFYIHFLNSLGYLLRFLPVHRIRTSCIYSTKTTATRTSIPQNHKSSGSRSPAFSHIGAITTLANGIQIIFIYNTTYLLIFLSCWETNSQPRRFFGIFLLFNLCYSVRNISTYFYTHSRNFSSKLG